jgi:hypothetical protein
MRLAQLRGKILIPVLLSWQISTRLRAHRSPQSQKAGFTVLVVLHLALVRRLRRDFRLHSTGQHCRPGAEECLGLSC